MAADVRVRALGRDGSGGGTVVALNGTPVNGSGWDPPPVPLFRMQDPVSVWPPANDVWSDAPDELELERARLEAEIAATKAKSAAARQRDAQMRAALHAEVIELQQRLAEMEQQHDMTIAGIREAGKVEAARILAEARQQVAGRAAGTTRTERRRENHEE